MTTDTTGEWRKSSRSNGSGGDCVEVSPRGGIRDSKNPAARLSISWLAVARVVTAIKAGEFDQ